MWPNRVGGIAATCAEAFRPYSPVLANLTGVCYWWGWVPTCGLTAMLSASALHEWYLPGVPVPLLAIAHRARVLRRSTSRRRAGPPAWRPDRVGASAAALPLAPSAGALGHGRLAARDVTSTSTSPFQGSFGTITSAMAGLYLIGFAAPAFEAAACHVGETIDPNAQRAARRATRAAAWRRCTSSRCRSSGSARSAPGRCGGEL